MRFLEAMGLGMAAVCGFALGEVPDTHVVHEKREALSSRWIKRGRVPGDKVLPVRIGMAQSNLDRAHDHLMAVSDPASPNYAKFWTAEEVAEAFKPREEAVVSVKRWLAENGFDNVTHSDNRGWIAFNAPASMVEGLLYTEFYHHEDVRTGTIHAATDVYHVPAVIQEHIDYIKPGIHLVAPMVPRGMEKHGTKRNSKASRCKQSRSHALNPYNLTTCDVFVTPACIAALYNITEPPQRPPHPDNALGIYSSFADFWDQFDLDEFFRNLAPWIPKGTHPLSIGIDGGVAETNETSEAGVETTLDLEVAYPIVYPQNITVFSEDDMYYQTNNLSGYYNDFLDAIDGSYCTYEAFNETGNSPELDPVYPDPNPNGYKGKLQCGVYKPTNVISVSYGGQEADVFIAYQKRQCNEYLKLGLQGVSLLFAAGDAGVGDFPYPDGSGCLAPDNQTFSPSWPLTCPFITGVGATRLYPGNKVTDPESAANEPPGADFPHGYSSGGGFSNIFPRPDYQKSALDAYFVEHNPPYPSYSALAADAPIPAYVDIQQLIGDTDGVYNRNGRGYPDVAANGDKIGVVLGGQHHMLAGTSAATPIFAAIINRIIEERLATGKGPLGFLNPALYANPGMLNDITNGSNPNCGAAGFQAVQGWDPVTGWGTPNYPKMLDYFLNLP